MIKIGTLCYLKANGKTLMLHRIKKANDMHAGKWNGLGGKLERGETPEQCAIREVYEESGLTITSPEFRGMLAFPGFSQEDDWYGYVFVAHHFSGEQINSPEGVLAWIDDDQVLALNLWPGDKIFLPWLEQDAFFSAQFVYQDGQLVDHHATFYRAGKVVGTIPAAPSPEPIDSSPHYTPADDTYC